MRIGGDTSLPGRLEEEEEEACFFPGGLGGTVGGLVPARFGGTGGGLELEREDRRECEATAPIGILPRGDCRGVTEFSRLHEPLPALKKGEVSGGAELPLWYPTGDGEGSDSCLMW